MILEPYILGSSFVAAFMISKQSVIICWFGSAVKKASTLTAVGLVFIQPFLSPFIYNN